MYASLTSACLSQRAVMEMLVTDRPLIKGQILAPLCHGQIISGMEDRQTDRHQSRDDEWSAAGS